MRCVCLVPCCVHCSALSSSLPLMVLGRVITGFGLGLASPLPTMYISEVRMCGQCAQCHTMHLVIPCSVLSWRLSLACRCCVVSILTTICLCNPPKSWFMHGAALVPVGLVPTFALPPSSPLPCSSKAAPFLYSRVHLRCAPRSYY